MKGLPLAESQAGISLDGRESVSSFNDKLKSLKEYESLLLCFKDSRLISQHLTKPVFTSIGPSQITPYQMAVYPLQLMLERTEKRFTFDESVFSQSLARLWSFLRRKRVVYKHVIPLMNFTSEMEEFAFDNRIRIRPFKASELENQTFLSGYSQPDTSRLKYAIEYLDIMDKWSGRSGVPKDYIDPVFWALRLCKSGQLVSSLHIVFPETKGPGQYRALGTSKWAPVILHARNAYSLKKADQRKLKLVWRQLRRKALPKALQIGLRRLDFSYDRSHQDDRLIDCVIALEATFLKEGENTEAGFRISTRLSKLLGKSFSERTIIRKDIQDFYSLRSKIVHGNEPDIEETVVQKLEEYVRVSFQRFLGKIQRSTTQDVLVHLDLD